MPASTRTRPLRRRLLFIAILLALATILAEIGVLFLYYFMVGEWFSYSEMRQRQMAVADEALTGAGGTPPDANLDQLFKIHQTPHPYVGYVYSTDLNKERFADQHHMFGINEFGFVDREPSLKKRREDRVIVGITGGSVALGVALQGAETLAAELRKHPFYRDKEISFVRLTLGGFKQPQQLMAAAYVLALGGELDVLINIDGFNEVVLPAAENFVNGVYPHFPRSWHLISTQLADRDLQRAVGRKVALEDSRRGWAQTFLRLPARYSATLQLIWLLRDRMLRGRIADAQQQILRVEGIELPFAATGPGTAGFSRENISARLVDHWMRCSIQLHRLCEANGILYLHFLQPNQYLRGSKPMGAAEQRVAINPESPYAPWATGGYPLLVEKGKELPRSGVDFHDLTMMYANIEEDLYVDDCCHVKARGYELMARRIAKAALAAAERDARERLLAAKLRELSVHPRTVTIRSPFTKQRLQVTGVFEDGRTERLELAAMGTHYEASPPDLVTVSPDGEVRAQREGRAAVTVANRGVRTTVRVKVRFDTVIPFGNGIPGSGGLVPRLDAAGEEATMGNGAFKVRVSRVVGGAAGVLIIGERAENGALRNCLLCVALDGMPVSVTSSATAGLPGAGRVTIAVPIPNEPSLRGVTRYCQAFFRDPGSDIGWSASNGLRISVK